LKSTVGIALLGRGTVGGGVAALLESRRTHIERRCGAAYDLVDIAHRGRDPLALAEDPRVDVVVEALGGTGIALDCIEHALDLRKHVVTANKGVIATQGPRLRALASARGVTLRYEASVASAVPIVGTLEHALAGDEIVEIGGVLNGTCNFVLGKMRDGTTLHGALRQAQTGGYAEADPRNDVDGIDAAHKLAILIQHAFDLPIVTGHLPHCGIADVTSAAVRRARQHGYELKLLAYARRSGNVLAAGVGPVLVPFAHPFARVEGVDNVVRVVGASAGPLLFSGAGAGREAAASAVLGDVVATLRAIAERRHAPQHAYAAPAVPEIVSAFERFPVFAGYPVLRQNQDTLGDAHVRYGSTALSAV
jgi:homoserine dehydrogenase